MCWTSVTQSRRNKAAAKKFMKKLLKKSGFAPRVMVTDKLKSYQAAKKEILPTVEHRQHKGLNNRAENSHQRSAVEGEEDAALQVCRSSAEVFGGFRIDLSAYATEETSVTCLHYQTCHGGTNAQLAGDDWG